MFSQEVLVTNKTGLHARPASNFVKRSSTFICDISISFKGKIINGKSMVGILAAGIVGGSTITINANSKDEKEAVLNLVELVKNTVG